MSTPSRVCRTATASLFLLGLALVFHQLDVLLHFACKLAFGSFDYSALCVRSFGLVEITCVQTAPMTPTARLATLLTPACLYLVTFATALLLRPRLRGLARLIGAWVIAFSGLYGTYLTATGLVCKSGALGAVEQQVGHVGWSAGLLAAFVASTVLALRRRALAAVERHVLDMAIALFPLIALTSYRFLHLTEPASIVCKLVLGTASLGVALRHGATLERELTPSSQALRAAAGLAALVAWIALPSFRQFRVNHYWDLRARPARPYPPVEPGAEIGAGLIVADEERHRVLLVHRDGTIETLIDGLVKPEVLLHDVDNGRILVAGAHELHAYALPWTGQPTVLLSDWQRDPIECLAATERGIVVGLGADGLALLTPEGALEPLASPAGPDSILPLAGNRLLVGTTRASAPGAETSGLFVVDLDSGAVELVELDRALDNVEVLAPDDGGACLLGIGNMTESRIAEVARVEELRRVSRLVRVSDVEGLTQLTNGEIAFSNDEMTTVFVLSRRGGVYPLVHLIDPDDLMQVGPGH